MTCFIDFDGSILARIQNCPPVAEGVNRNRSLARATVLSIEPESAGKDSATFEEEAPPWSKFM